jgi:uncharacterized membrane protein YgdD (TMEM256/DUF423 family)
MTANRLLTVAAVLAGTAVALGAFGAHAMKEFPAADLATFETAVRYQMYHALALLACGVLQRLGTGTRTASIAFLAGIALFSGSLYALVWTGQRWLGAVTPIGGVAFLVGWAVLARAASRPPDTTAD